MGIDIKTVVLILGITHLIQVFVFTYQYITNKNIKGPGWWLLWSAFESVGFILIILRTIPFLNPVMIVFQNVVILMGTIFIYIGIVKFLGGKLNLRYILLFFSAFLLLHFYFIFIDNNISIRSLIISAFISLISFITAQSIQKHKTSTTGLLHNFNMAIFILHGTVFAYRAIIISMGTKVTEIFAPTLFNFIPYFDALIVSLLWTFGFLMMVNQKLNSEINEAKTHFELVFNTSPDASVISRLSDGLFIDCNESFTRILGFSKVDITGKLPKEIMIWGNPGDYHAMYQKINEEHFCENLESMFQRKNGQKFTGLLSARIIYLKEIPHLISVIRDITERKQIEEEIKFKNEELNKINAQKDKFFSIIAHDLRSPFNSIIGFSDMLIEQVKNKDYGGIGKYADIIWQSSNRAMDLLMNLMEWSRSQTGMMEFNPEYFEMVNLINEVELQLINTAHQKSIIITKSLPPNVPVFADKAMTSAVLRNLVSNAIKFTPQGGEIIISVEEQKNKLIISVSDNGVGIPKASIEKLFRIDQNLTTHGTQNERGTGLGLVLCKEFVEKHRGKIWVKSEEGKGSVFYFTIPINSV